MNNRLLKIIFGLGSSVFAYYTLKLYIKKRKFDHLPGPKAKGFLNFEFYVFFFKYYLS